MKTLTTVASFLLAAGLATAQTTSSPDDRSRTGSGSSSSTSTTSSSTTRPGAAMAPVAVEIVSVDPGSNTITVTTPPAGRTGAAPGTAQPMTLPVEGKAQASLKQMKMGDQISVVCRQVSTGTTGLPSAINPGTINPGTGSASSERSPGTANTAGGTSGSASSERSPGTAGTTGTMSGSTSGSGNLSGSTLTGAPQSLALQCSAITEITKSRAMQKSDSTDDPNR